MEAVTYGRKKGPAWPPNGIIRCGGLHIIHQTGIYPSKVSIKKRLHGADMEIALACGMKYY
jgi:hypothetical protein